MSELQDLNDQVTEMMVEFFFNVKTFSLTFFREGIFQV